MKSLRNRYAAAARQVTTELLEGRTMMAVHPLSAVPQMESLPGAAATLYLDFNGHTFSGKWHTNTDDPGNPVHFYPGTSPAYTSDDNATTFDDAELGEIRRIWSFVADKFSPFKLNVSTKPAPATLADRQSYVMVVGGNGSWYGSSTARGVALTGSFSSSAGANVGYVFSADPFTADDRVIAIAHSVAHEAGHGFGLHHQSRWNGNTVVEPYHTGTDDHAPLMGNNFDAARATWWVGHHKDDDTGAKTAQDDLAVLSGSSNGFGYRNDDHANSFSSASTLNLIQDGVRTRRGVIERAADVDYFKFNNGNAEKVSIRVERPERGSLDADLRVRKANGDLVATAYTSNPDDAIILTNLAPNQELRPLVKGHEQIGDVGQYRLKVMAANITGAADVWRGHQAALTVQDFGPGAQYAWDLDGDGAYGETGAAAFRGVETGRAAMYNATTANAGTYTIRAKVTNAEGMESIAKWQLTVKKPKVTITATDPNAGEGSVKGYNGQVLGAGTIRLTRDGPTAQPLAVAVQPAAANTAVNGTDYAQINASTVTIPAGKSYVDVTINPTDDAAVEPQELAGLKVLPSPAYGVHGGDTAYVVINDNDLHAPTSVGAVAQGGKKIRLTWADNSYNETSWLIRRSTTPNFAPGTFSDAVVAGANATTHLTGTLQSGTTYFFKLRAVNDNGVSAWSSVVSAAAHS